MRRSLRMAGWIGVLVPAFLPAADRIVLVPPAMYHEEYPDRVLIGSSAVVLGWQGGDVDQRLTGPELSVGGIREGDRTLCIAVAHVSGGYLGSARLRVGPRTARQTFRLPATIFARRPGIRSADLVMLVQASPTARCSARSPTLTAAWGTRAEAGSSNLYLNAGRGTVTRLSLAGLSRTVACERLDDLLPDPRVVRQRFNTVCRAKLPQRCTSDLAYEIVTDAGDGAAPPIQGVLRRACEG